MKTPINIAGKKFGRLIVVAYSHSNRDKKACWICVCDCGKEVVVSGKSLRNGRTKSCGCYALEVRAKSSTKHGACKNSRANGKTLEYYIWRGIIARCTNPNNKKYADYGGRGITICDEWRHDYKAFIDYIGNKPSPGYSIERINNDRNYEPGNIRWATQKEQMNNTRVNRFLTYNGKSQTVSQWADELKIPYNRIAMRLHRGNSVEKALTV
jgi:hypothetical protein